MKFDVQQQTRTRFCGNKVLNNESEKKEVLKAQISGNNKICNKCDCLFVSKHEKEKSINGEIHTSYYGANQTPIKITGDLCGDQSGVQEVDIECRVAGEEISLHILCIVRQQV